MAAMASNVSGNNFLAPSRDAFASSNVARRRCTSSGKSPPDRIRRLETGMDNDGLGGDGVAFAVGAHEADGGGGLRR